MTWEDGVPLGEGTAMDVEYKTEGVTLEGKCNPDPYLINDGTSTGMKVTKVERQQTESVYDLQGRRINGKPAKGIYIIGGKKFILR